jgi:hypothetical protein
MTYTFESKVPYSSRYWPINRIHPDNECLWIAKDTQTDAKVCMKRIPLYPPGSGPLDCGQDERDTIALRAKLEAETLKEMYRLAPKSVIRFYDFYFDSQDQECIIIMQL